MGLFDRLRRKGPDLVSFGETDLRLRPMPPESGVEGAELVLPDGAPADDALLAAVGAMAVEVAGTSHCRDALDEDAFSPGNPVVLRPEPENPFDPNAVAVFDAGGELHAGYVPGSRALELVDDLEDGLPYEAVVLSTRFDRVGRCGMKILIAKP